MTTILVPPGIGDIYWVMVKLRGFCRYHGIEQPEIWVDAPNDKKRSKEFVERIPFVKFGGYFDSSATTPTDSITLDGRNRRKFGTTSQERIDAYTQAGKHVFQNVDGFDWFISYNGLINAGKSLDEIDTEWPAEWDLHLTQDNEEELYGKELRDSIGPYITAAFFDAGFYRMWIKELGATKIYTMLAEIADRCDVKIVLTGASWDESKINSQIIALDAGNGRIVSLIGKTTLSQYIGALKYSKGCIGFPAGNTMMGVVYGVPTCLIWNDFFNSRMHVNALPPNSKHYLPVNTKHKPEEIASSFIEMLDNIWAEL